MDTKIPKPSGLKKPAQMSRNILPCDRIKTASQFTSNKTTLFNSGSFNMTLGAPLTRDLVNIPEAGILRLNRAASPEIRPGKTVLVRGKLRRSRSATDLRAESQTNNAVPNKTMRLMSSCNTSGYNKFNPNANCSAVNNRLQRFAHHPVVPKVNTTASASLKTGNNRTVTTNRAGSAPPATRAAAGRSNLTSQKSTVTSVATTGAGKPINKRIPPYDFKARYNDLLEKHKVLKEKYELKCEQMGSLESLPEQLEEVQAKLINVQEQLENEQTQNECLRNQVNKQNTKIEITLADLIKTKDELKELKKLHQKISQEHAALSTEVVELRTRSSELTQNNNDLKSELEASKDQLFFANIERKELHNAVMDLRGNIRVFCRVRPSLPSERDKIICPLNYLDEATLEIQNPDLFGKNKASSHVFQFDQVFHHNSSQEEIFEMVSPLIQSALDGYNVCIFAYGQTGSGKTYTMDGVSEQEGIIPRTVELLFDAVKRYKRLGWEYEMRVNFLEIYNEVLYDLLSNEQKEMEIRMVKNSKNDIYVSNITEEVVENAAQLHQLMNLAKGNRATASTIGNDRSSRSHAVTKIILIGTHAEKNEVSIGTINLVDLAGSESPKTSIRMNETKNINRSLAELSNVILSLMQRKEHVPYRNSKLTHLLMPSLGGNSKTLMFINVAPFLDCYEESVKSLRFAASVNSCTMTKAKRNKFLNNANPGTTTSF